MYVLLKFNFVKKLQENAQAKLLTTSNVLCKQCFQKIEPRIFAKSPFFNLDLQKTRIFLKTHTKRLMFHYQLFYSVQLAFLVLGSIFDGGFFKKFSYFVIFKKWCFCKKFLAQFSYKQCFHNTFKVVINFT